MTRACECGAPISRSNRSGRCRPCCTRRLHADPAYRAKMAAGLAAHYAKPGAREAAGERLKAYMRDLPDAERERRRAHGHRQAEQYLSRPDIFARSQTPEKRRAAGRKSADKKLAWCPEELRPAYLRLVRSNRYPAAEARAIIEAEIPGTLEHAHREIASRSIAQQLRHERDQRDAY